MDIGVIGSGNIGSALASQLTALDWVSIANSRADSRATRGVRVGTPGRMCLSVAGDDVHSKQVVLALIDALGFDGLDAGTLADSWRQQPGTPAYCRDLETAALKAALAQADAGKTAQYRADADELARPYFAALRT